MFDRDRQIFMNNRAMCQKGKWTHLEQPQQQRLLKMSQTGVDRWKTPGKLQFTPHSALPGEKDGRKASAF